MGLFGEAVQVLAELVRTWKVAPRFRRPAVGGVGGILVDVAVSRQPAGQSLGDRRRRSQLLL
ncbi:hypothetical protein BMS3Bbin01_02055 [bacterium BMS3Bbin01]|nr:hypothetical protein BMS3Bbin01_02055 [bacterium BMS3Bbin01]